MKDLDYEIIKERIERMTSDLKLFAKDEADKAREKAVISFGRIAVIISILLTIIGLLGINALAKRSVDRFIEEKGVVASLQNLTMAKDSARQLLDLITNELGQAKSSANQIASLTPNLPHVLGVLETNVPADYGEEESRWRYVPYQDNKPLDIPINVMNKDEVFFVAFNYRSIGSVDGFKASRINVMTTNETSVKTIEAIGGVFKGNQFGASGSAIIANLARGQYKVRVEDFDGLRSHKKYDPGRQMIVYKLR